MKANDVAAEQSIKTCRLMQTNTGTIEWKSVYFLDDESEW